MIDDQPNDDAAPPARTANVTPMTDAVASDSAEPRGGLRVVGIGASAGAMGALTALFRTLSPAQATNVAFVLVQHLPPQRDLDFVELLQHATALKVVAVEDGGEPVAGHVHVQPAGHELVFDAGRFKLSRPADGRPPYLPVDRFFGSLATASGENAVAIVLSGAGSDGTLGARAVRAEGGIVIAQSPDSAEYPSMPRSAISTGMVDYVLAPADMPAQLVAYAPQPLEVGDRAAPALRREAFLRRLCVLLRSQTGHDFSQYKATTLVRRTERRMAMRQIGDAEQYLRYARDNPQELEALFRDLLIGVTQFFRDPDAFRVLEDKVVPRLVAAKGAHETLRVWVAGCSTGEEAYSIAILLYEHLLQVKRVLKVQIFATDLDHQAIEHARSGIYPASIAAQVSEERLLRFFVHDPLHSTYRIQKHVRDLLVFSEQDLIRDPPFSKLDLVSCRNLLIYLNGTLQRRLIPLFHYALVPEGMLFLGTSETLGDAARLFAPIDRKWKIFQRLSDGGSARPALPSFVPSRLEPGEAARAASSSLPELPGLRTVAERELLAHYGQAGVLVDSNAQIHHIIGRTGRFLEPADGDADMNVLAMARDGLKRELTVALHKAVAYQEPVLCPGLSVREHGGFVVLDLAVLPVDAGGGTVLYLVALREVPQRDPGEGAGGTDPHGRIGELESELRAKDEHLQTALEEMETTNEELKSTNEEMQSVNEELQSTNEELETSKEELQSVNEELSTVNAELQEKLADLSRANNDMNNLLAGTGVGTVFVDHHLRITRFTPEAAQVINLIATDLGRPLEHVVTNLVGYDGMVGDIVQVLDTLAPREMEVQVKGGTWFIMRIRPYRTMENLIEGAVVTFVDISARKRAEASLRASEERLKLFINRAYAGVCEAGLDGRLLFVNDRLCETLGYTRDELLAKRLEDLTDAADRDLLQGVYARLLEGGPGVEIARRWVGRGGVRVAAQERISLLRDAAGAPASMLMLLFDSPAGGGAA